MAKLDPNSPDRETAEKQLDVLDWLIERLPEKSKSSFLHARRRKLNGE
jgi:hypothetical protein